MGTIMGAVAVTLLFVYGFIILVSLAAAVLTIIGQWKIFNKAGKHGWAAIIPFYNSYVLYEIGNFPPALIAVNISVFVIGMLQAFLAAFAVILKIDLSFILLLSSLSTCGGLAIFVIMLLVNMNIAKKFGKSAGYGVGMTFLPFIFCMMLGCDKDAVYNENI